jgi:hypothetical protein
MQTEVIDLTITTVVAIANDKIDNILLTVFNNQAVVAKDCLIKNKIINFDNSSLCLLVIDNNLYLALKPSKNKLKSNTNLAFVECSLPTPNSIQIQELMHCATNLGLKVELSLQFVAERIFN